MREVAEEGAAIRVVAHVLNDGAAVGVGLGATQVFLRGLRIFFQKQGLDVALPRRVDDGFMRKDGVGLRRNGPCQENAEQADELQAKRSDPALHHSNRLTETAMAIHARESKTRIAKV